MFWLYEQLTLLSKTVIHDAHSSETLSTKNLDDIRPNKHGFKTENETQWIPLEPINQFLLFLQYSSAFHCASNTQRK